MSSWNCLREICRLWVRLLKAAGAHAWTPCIYGPPCEGILDPTPHNPTANDLVDSILYNVMYQIIDTCYGQNLGLEEFPPGGEIVSVVLKGDRELDEWRHRVVPPLGLRIWEVPLEIQELEKIDAKDKTVQRFSLVLSLRFHNLRILNHRPILEKFLDTYSAHGGSGTHGFELGMMHQVCISSIENCVDSAMIIISIVHTVVLTSGWRRDLLGAWNYSLFYGT